MDLLPYRPALLALTVAALGSLAVRGRRAGWAGLPGTAAVAAGWLALLPLAAAGRAVLAPRAMPDFLLLPALAAVALSAVLPRLAGRAAWWAPAVLAGAAAIWVAGSPAGRPEFWRVSAVLAVLSLVMVQGVAGAGGRWLAAGLALSGGLLAAGAPPVWLVAALVLAAAGVPAASGGAALGPAPAMLAATALSAASLAAGRLVRGGLNGVDLACAATVAAPWLVPLLAARLGRQPGWLRAVLPAVGAAVLVVAAAWAGIRLLHR